MSASVLWFSRGQCHVIGAPAGVGGGGVGGGGAGGEAGALPAVRASCHAVTVQRGS